MSHSELCPSADCEKRRGLLGLQPKSRNVGWLFCLLFWQEKSECPAGGSPGQLNRHDER
jgi:hypothetical protein